MAPRLASIFALLIPVALTIVDYDGRYRLPAELCLLPLAAAGSKPLLDRLREAVARYTTRGVGMGTMKLSRSTSQSEPSYTTRITS